MDGDFFVSDEVAADMSRLVFTGVMSYPPNEDAAVHFAEDVLPLVQRTHPHAEFWVVGKSPPDRVRALADRPGVHVTGGVPDIRPYVLGAGIFVCPLRYGAGVKNKLLAALSMKRAVVASAMSLEGLEFRHGEELLIADEPAQVAAHIARLMDDPALARRMGEAGHAAVKARYSWATSAQMLARVLATAADASSGRRPITAGV
ncbi:MAG: glycosyltransferase [Gemmatimonadaceae bacterium]|nr:glycosyltransferase [Gemmatimonadaceae bacterium]